MPLDVVRLDDVYRRRKDRLHSRNKPNSSPNVTQQAKNLYETGKGYKFVLLNGESFQGTLLKQAQYELEILAIGKGKLIIPKHSILYAEVL